MTEPRLQLRGRRIGKDDFGRIAATGGPCEVCKRPGLNLCVTYLDGLKVLEDLGINLNHTILKDHTYIGILCGCYGKFHRQVAHIEDKMKGRKP